MQPSRRALLPGIGEVFPPIPPQNPANWQKNSSIFLAFFFLCNKISFWELKDVLFALFLLNKFVFNTQNKNLTQAVSMFSAVDAAGFTVYLLLICF